MLSVPVVLLSTAVFLALIANLALKPAFSSRLTLRCIIVSAAAGLIIYGVGFAEATGNLALSVVRTPLSVTRMFAGINELAAIEGTALVRSPLGLTLFWLVHMLAFFPPPAPCWSLSALRPCGSCGCCCPAGAI